MKIIILTTFVYSKKNKINQYIQLINSDITHIIMKNGEGFPAEIY